MERKSLGLLIGLAQGLPSSPWYAIISATPETAQHLKTMTLIETTNNGTFFTLTTEKGNTVEVSTSLGHVMVFIQRKGLKQLVKGRRFASVAAAAESYKAADIKAALYALAEA